jgi:hypothetical protein
MILKLWEVLVKNGWKSSVDWKLMKEEGRLECRVQEWRLLTAKFVMKGSASGVWRSRSIKGDSDKALWLRRWRGAPPEAPSVQGLEIAT